ncbi:Carboxylesterase [Umbelopsis sp. PMI_123]|nr:Carboxylesterase [Umbelopsis sp. PMI_123]
MKGINIIHFVISYLCFVQFSQAISETPVVDLGYVKYTGIANTTTGINHYPGIRYASAPVGERRWRKAVPIEKDNSYNGSTIHLTDYAPICYQSSPSIAFSMGSARPASEDCLALDVLVPKKKKKGLLPVIVMIHGGGYTTGSSTSYVYGDSLVYRSNGGVIYVAIQYRLGMLGFLGGSEVRRHGDLNIGLLDQRLALQWIQNFIHPFGGDPNKITIDGGSAGGGSVTYQLMAYGGQKAGLFRSAIAEYPWWQSFKPESIQEEQYQTVLKQANCTSIDCLRSLPTDKIEELSASTESQWVDSDITRYAYGDFYYGPVIDGDFIKELPSKAFASGRFTHVPILTNRDSDEGLVFSNPNETAQELVHDLNSLFFNPPQSFLDTLDKLYPPSAYNNSVFNRRKAIFGDNYINCGTEIIAISSVHYLKNPSSVFKFISSANSGIHGSLSAYIMVENVNGPFGLNNTLGYILQDYYLSFIIHQDPNVEKNSVAPYFPSYSSGNQVLIVSDENVVPGIDLDAREQCYFFHNWSNQTNN